MHELTLCSKIIALLTEQAKQNHITHVKKVWLAVGELAGIDLDALHYGFSIASAHSIAKNADLEIVSVDGAALCIHCQQSVHIKNYLDSCPLCGQYDYQITQGKELRIVKMEGD